MHKAEPLFDENLDHPDPEEPGSDMVEASPVYDDTNSRLLRDFYARSLQRYSHISCPSQESISGEPPRINLFQVLSIEPKEKVVKHFKKNNPSVKRIMPIVVQPFEIHQSTFRQTPCEEFYLCLVLKICRSARKSGNGKQVNLIAVEQYSCTRPKALEPPRGTGPERSRYCLCWIDSKVKKVLFGFWAKCNAV